MNHSFTPSATNATKCRCGYDEISHTDMATCEVCGAVGSCNLMYGNILMCKDCEAKERELIEQKIAENNEAIRAKGLPVANNNPVLAIAQEIDNRVKVRTDIHNSETMAIVDMKKTIDEDPSIENKHFALSKMLEARYLNFGEKIFSKKEEITALENQQMAIQRYYNELSKQLRAEEKAQIRLKDVTYQPKEPKVAKPRVSKPSINKIELDKLCTEHNVPKNIVSIVLMQKPGMTIAEAVRHVKSTLGLN